MGSRQRFEGFLQRFEGLGYGYTTEETFTKKKQKMLPFYNEKPAQGGTTTTSTQRPTTSMAIFNYLRRICSPSQMDFEYTCRQMVDLIFSPSKVYELSKYRKRTRNQWARDDPAFIVLLFLFMLVCSVAYGIAFGMTSVGEYGLLIFYTFLQVFVIGSVVATLTSTVANSKMRIVGDAHSVDQHVEWLYAFDIHANALFPTFLLLSVGQYVLLPLLLRPTYSACLFANSLYALGGLTYVYITHLGYRSMPFLRNSQAFLMPAGIVLVACILLTIFDLNLCRFTIWFVFE